MIKNQLVSVSYLRICATVSVIWLHTCSTLTDNLELFNLSKYQIAFYSSSYQMMNWAVPIFFMITGVLLLNPQKTITLEMCMKKYVSRILLAIVVFGIPYALLKLILVNNNMNITQIYLAIKAVVGNNGFGHLWYLYTLVGIYLILPYVKGLLVNENKIHMLLVILFVMDFCIPCISNILNIEIAFDLPFQYSLFYVISGYYINKHKKYLCLKRKIIAALIAFCIVSIWLINYLGFASKAWTSYSSPLIGILSILVFSFFISGNFQAANKIWKIDRLCFGVYLIHPLFIQFVYRYLKLTPNKFEFYPLFTLFFFVIFVCCAFSASWIMGKIKPLKKYIL